MKIKSFVKYRITLNAFILKDIDILAFVPEKTIKALKEKEEHPFLQAYILAHPGEFTPEIEGEKPQPIVWDAKSIKSFTEINVIGQPIYLGHDSREEMGKIIYAFMKDDSFIIVSHHPRSKVSIASKCDICSQEAEWNTFEMEGKIFADSVEKLTGVAIQQSSKESPAFTGAMRIAQVYAFEGKGDPKTMTLAEVKQAVTDLNIRPYQLFGIEDIKLDQMLGKEYNSISAEVETLKNSLKEKETALEQVTNEKAELAKSVAQSTAKSRLDKIMVDKKCTDKQKEKIEKRFSDIKSVDDLSDEGLNNFVDDSINLIKLFSEPDTGSQDPNPPNPPNPDNGDGEGYDPGEDFDPENI